MIYHHQRNAGLSAARNAALQIANFDRILFLDADDRLTSECLALACARFEADEQLAFVHGGYLEIDSNGRRLAAHDVVDSGGFIGLLSGNHIAMHGTVLYSTGRLRGVGGFDETLRSCEDYDVYLRLARQYPVAAYHGIAAEYRRHGAAMSRYRLRMIDTARQVIARHVRLAGNEAAHRRAARIGAAYMTDYYRDEIWADLANAWTQRRLVLTAIALLRDAGRHPVAFGHFASRTIAGLLQPRS